MTTLHLQRPAMATWFEIWLAGDDPEHLAAVGEAALDEIERVERLLSRFDPAAEVARVNRTAAAGPVRVDTELFAILEDCRRWTEATAGYFDITATTTLSPGDFRKAVQLDAARRRVQFLDARVRLDLGGYGKGYALDAAGRILEQFGVTSALLHGGTSSVLARGVREDGAAWPVGVRDPYSSQDCELTQLRLCDCGLSSSAVLGASGETSDVIDPTCGRPLEQQAGCVVVAPTAVEAEVLSTALLAMGRDKAQAYLSTQSANYPQVQVAWLERTELEAESSPGGPPRSRIEWLSGDKKDGD